ncbi:hypothetical protein EYF80_019920 [Liparis tanakae]|uniref:Uncharacterized protein n=1 Tax=Liparis tanakae TaxID=230148 RepID=A0A4Z2HY41_9TELE|nr:hypothetical protein EYF80_019920 [Liparis tanakae]
MLFRPQDVSKSIVQLEPDDYATISVVPFTLRASIWASCWQHCPQSGCSLVRLNSPSRSQELHSRLLEKPSPLHASDDRSAPYADSWREEGKDETHTERMQRRTSLKQ